MAIKVKDAASVARKWRERASAAGGDYKAGVERAGQDWETGATAGADNYKQGVAQAASEGRFERGVRASGAAFYAKRASEIGAQRFPTGVGAAEGDMAAGVGPVLQTIASIDLPPRRPKGDPGNMQRAAVVAAKLRAMKVGK